MNQKFGLLRNRTAAGRGQPALMRGIGHPKDVELGGFVGVALDLRRICPRLVERHASAGAQAGNGRNETAAGQADHQEQC